MQRFYIKKINNKETLVYNSISHTPVLLDKDSFNHFNHLAAHDFDIDKAVKYVNISEEKHLKKLFTELYDNDFFLFDESRNNNINQETEFRKKDKHFYFHLTHRCNLKCIYCYNEFSRTNVEDLGLNSWKQITDKVVNQIKSITITGGEPFLYKDLYELISYIKSHNKNIRIDIISNGSIDFTSNDNFFKIFDSINNISLSCDNISSNKHERVGFKRETFKKNINALISNGFGSKILINSVYARGNIDILFDVYNYAKEKNVKFVTSLRMPLNMDDIHKLPKVEEYKKYLYESDIFKRTDVKDKEDLPKITGCSAGIKEFSFDAKGDCYPCQSFHYPEFKFGNILRNSFRDLYFSDTAKNLRNANNVLNIEECKECNLKYLCGGGCIAQTYNLHGSISKYPEILCSYYKTSSLYRLETLSYE